MAYSQTFRFLVVAVLWGGLTTSASVRAQTPAQVDFLVDEQIAANGTADVLVVFDGYPDLSAASALATKEEKARFVFEALRQNSLRHAALLSKLQEKGIATEHLWAANAVHVPAANRQTLALLRQTRGVERVAAVQQWQIDELERQEVESIPTKASDVRSRAPVPTWGVRYLGADKVWEMGIRGEGAVVAGADTGYDWQHPALKSKYRGLKPDGTAEHDYNWFDGVKVAFPGTSDANPCGFSTQQPCDDGSHGTHTMGTMVGSDGPANQIGVAPGASWMACRNMDRGNGTPTSYLNCFQFFLAPTDLAGNNPRPELAPDVIANSWYCPLSEGCDSSTYPAFTKVVEALRAAGTVVIVSAGNDGRQGCGTINDIPARTPGAFAIGAHDSLGRIANFSSKGSFALDGAVIRPDVAMPGVSVRSSVPNGGYANFNGTSMSGPHAAGVVALMISANPRLRGQVDTIEAILRRSAVPTPAPAGDQCSVPGQDVPNNVFGHGIGDALKAVQMAQAFPGTVPVDELLELRFSVAPNPASGRFVLELPVLWQDAEVVVTNATGQTVLRTRASQTRTDIGTDGWASGVYIVTVSHEGVRSSERLIVRR